MKPKRTRNTKLTQEIKVHRDAYNKVPLVAEMGQKFHCQASKQIGKRSIVCYPVSKETAFTVHDITCSNC